MNKTELLTYLHHCLDQSRPSQCADGIDLLSSGLAAHMAATRGPSARLDTGDRMGLNKAWGQSGLAERVEESLRARRRAEPNVEQFIIDSVTASLALGREPSGVDTEQAARVRWLAEALQAFQTLSDRSLVGLGTEQFVSDIKLGKGLPPEQSRQQRLSDWLSETIKYLENFNPAAQNEDDLELCDLLEDSQPTLLADLVRRAAPRHNEFDHEHLERQINKLRGLQARLPMLIETMRDSARRIRLASDELDAPPNVSVSPTPHPVPQEAAVKGESIAVVARRLVERNLGRSTGFPLLDDAGSIGRIAAIASDLSETRQLAEHQDILLHELQHRVRNIMGMIRSMTNRSAAGSEDVDDYRQRLNGRLMALARVQVLLTQAANVGGSLRQLIETEVHAQAHHSGQLELTGPDLTLSPKAVEVLTLAFHELTTNALKYGALSVEEGVVRVSWRLIDKSGAPWLSLDWIEHGGPARTPSTRRGFGSELIEARMPYELRGSGKVSIGEGGARCHLEFPLREAESILETDAPRPTTIFGGSLDMTAAPDLRGQKILIVEDDY